MTTNPGQKDIKRTILYYPRIDIPDGYWLRQSLLYWDEISSIVPYSYSSNGYDFSPEIDFLKSEGFYRPIYSDALLKVDDPDMGLYALEEEFVSLLSSEKFTNLLNSKVEYPVALHRNKISERLIGDLLSKGLAVPSFDNPDEWFAVEKNTAIIFMGLFAKYLADADSQLTIPGTETSEYEKMIYSLQPNSSTFPCLGVNLHNSLPTPRLDIPLDYILTFKDKRKFELLNLRKRMDEFSEKISKSENINEAKNTIVKFNEEITRETHVLAQLLEESRISAVFGSLKSIINVKSPTLWASLGVMLNQATKTADLPQEWIIPGILTAGTTEIVCHLVDKRNEKRAILRDSSFAYLYHAQKEMVI